MCEAIEDLGDLDKLGQGFTSADPLEKVDIGDGSIPRPTFVNANLSNDCKADLIKLLKDYDCYTQIKLKRRMWEINSKRKGQIKVKLHKEIKRRNKKG